MTNRLQIDSFRPDADHMHQIKSADNVFSSTRQNSRLVWTLWQSGKFTILASVMGCKK